ncbi:MAG: SH3 domain-containing protein [Acidobacteria bacterium]|nr:SH3 domain-containing protein [Acidobacteriota bacterium]
MAIEILNIALLGHRHWSVRPNIIPPVKTEAVFRSNGFGTFITGLILGVIGTLAGMAYYSSQYPGSGWGPLTGGPGATATATVEQSRESTIPGSENQLTALRVRLPQVPLRDGPCGRCRVIFNLSEGDIVKVIERGQFRENNEWIKVSVGGQEGWLTRFDLE